MLTLHNFDEHPHTVRLRLKAEQSTLSNLLSPTEVYAGKNGRFEVALDALSYGWFRLGGLNYGAS